MDSCLSLYNNNGTESNCLNSISPNITFPDLSQLSKKNFEEKLRPKSQKNEIKLDETQPDIINNNLRDLRQQLIKNDDKTPKAQIYVDNLPPEMTKEKFKEKMEQFGKIIFLKFLKHKNDIKSVGYGFVAYGNIIDAYRAIKVLNGFVINSNCIRASFARPETQVLSTTNLYVCGLPLMYRSEQLKELFSQFGPISETRVLNSTILAESKGVGFVHFFNSDDARKAVTIMNNTSPKGIDNPLIVKFARDVRKNLKKGRYLDSNDLCVSNNLKTPYSLSTGYGTPLNHGYESFNPDLPNINFQQAPPCKYFISGKCNRGLACNFSHLLESDKTNLQSEEIRSLRTWGVISDTSISPNVDVPNATENSVWNNYYEPKKQLTISPRLARNPPLSKVIKTSCHPDKTSNLNYPNSSYISATAKINAQIPTERSLSEELQSYSKPNGDDFLSKPSEAVEENDLVTISKQNGQAIPGGQQIFGGTSKTNLYVSQFPQDWTSGNLEEIFSTFGEIDKIRILTPENAEKNRGVGFVHFKTAKSALGAINGTQNHIPQDCYKPIIVKFANQGIKSSRGVNPAPNVCRFWLKGECVRGSLCSFKHESYEGSLVNTPNYNFQDEDNPDSANDKAIASQPNEQTDNNLFLNGFNKEMSVQVVRSKQFPLPPLPRTNRVVNGFSNMDSKLKLQSNEIVKEYKQKPTEAQWKTAILPSKVSETCLGFSPVAKASVSQVNKANKLQTNGYEMNSEMTVKNVFDPKSEAKDLKNMKDETKTQPIISQKSDCVNVSRQYCGPIDPQSELFRSLAKTMQTEKKFIPSKVVNNDEQSSQSVNVGNKEHIPRAKQTIHPKSDDEISRNPDKPKIDLKKMVSSKLLEFEKEMLNGLDRPYCFYLKNNPNESELSEADGGRLDGELLRLFLRSLSRSGLIDLIQGAAVEFSFCESY